MGKKRANGEGSIYQRKDGLWVAEVTIGRDAATGRLVRKQIYAKTKQDAAAKKQAMLEQLKQVTGYIDADKITVGEWLKKWLEVYARPSVRPNTFQSYRIMVEKYIIPALGHIRIVKLQPIQIQQMINAILADGKSARTAKYAYSVLRAALLRAVEDGLLLRAPKAAAPKQAKKNEVRPLERAEWDALLRAAAASPDMYVALLLEWATGMRRSEILGLKWADIDFKASTVHIQRAAIITDGAPMLADPKSASSRRVIALPPVVISELKRHKKRQAALRLKSPCYEDNGLVFPTDEGRLQDPRSWSKKFRRIVKAAGLSINFHQLRHDFASRLATGGVGIKEAQYQLGHSSTRMLLDVYTHRMTSSQQKIVAVLDANAPDCIKADG